MRPDFHILLVEDSRADALIIQRALDEERVGHRLTVLPDGPSALTYLGHLRDAPTSDASEPDLILLDLNLPGLDGCQVLSRIKADPALRPIPVVVLSTSDRAEEVLAAYRAGANSFVQKPSEYPLYRHLAAALLAFWHETALGPPRRDGA